VGSSATDLDPIDVAAGEAVPATRRLAAIAWVSFVLLGWAGLLIPSLFRSVKADFDLTDSAIGTFYLVNADLLRGRVVRWRLVTERVGRRPVLSIAGLFLGAGLALEATAPTWTVFLFAAVPAGLGAGVIDGGMNGLVLDLFRRRPGGALNLLHLGLQRRRGHGPIVVGQLVGAGADWRAIILATAAWAVVIGTSLRAPPHADRPSRPSGRRRTRHHGFGRVPILPIVALALAIGFYVSSEIGVSSWLVRFLDSATNDVATAALGLFWGALRSAGCWQPGSPTGFPPVAFAGTCALAGRWSARRPVASPSLRHRSRWFRAERLLLGPSTR
jgi:fucose permease